MMTIRPLALAFAIFLGLCWSTMAQDHQGHQGRGHEKWHGEFYSKLNRPDLAGKHSCCNLSDCRPTVERRSPHGYYEVMVDGVWVIVPPKKIVPISAPDGGAHVCAQKAAVPGTGALYCVILPPET